MLSTLFSHEIQNAALYIPATKKKINSIPAETRTLIISTYMYLDIYIFKVSFMTEKPVR